MKYIRTLFTLTIAVILFSAFSPADKDKGKNSEKKVYAFGIAASFQDTVVYYTPIQVLDSVKLDKNKFLPQRQQYSYQLKNYLEYEMQKSDYTCMIYFSENKEKLQKEASKMKGKYTKGYALKELSAGSFTFKKPQE